MKADFNIAFSKTLQIEGGYVNDPNDLGGETFKGIARKYWPNWKGWKIIDQVKDSTFGDLDFSLNGHSELNQHVYTFYMVNFWDKCGLDHMDSQAVAEEIYDTAVNGGVKRACKFFQTALNELNNRQKDYPDIGVDGDVGTKTITAYKMYMGTANKYRSRTTAKNEKVLLIVLNGEQYLMYKNSIGKRESQEKYFYGWMATRVNIDD